MPIQPENTSSEEKLETPLNLETIQQEGAEVRSKLETKIEFYMKRINEAQNEEAAKFGVARLKNVLEILNEGIE